ncbi:MAG: stage III sporulation protein AE [Clostridia bacterium]|nr:stage III sporulation protein AE [Clostridia bacterium]
MKKKIIVVILLIFALFPLALSTADREVCADELSDTALDQADNLDLDELKDFFNQTNAEDYDFFTTFKNILQGKYDKGNNIFDYIKNVVFSEVKTFIPVIIGIIVVALLCEIVQNSKSVCLSESVGLIVKFVAVLTIIVLLFPEFVSIWNKTKNLIENIGKFSEIMSPIILTLMVASGGATSAAIYQPSVILFTDVIITVFYAVVMPLVGILTAFNVMSFFSKDIKLKRFSDFFGGLLKWIFGIILAVYGLFITMQGISVSATDGISAKIAKFAVSNSVPIVGGLIRDGVDIVAAGSVIVKNALGVAGLTGIFYIILAPVLHMAVFSLLLKFAAAATDVFAGDTVPNFLAAISKSINYLIASALTVGLMAFLTVLFMFFSANSVI